MSSSPLPDRTSAGLRFGLAQAGVLFAAHLAVGGGLIVEETIGGRPLREVTVIAMWGGIAAFVVLALAWLQAAEVRALDPRLPYRAWLAGAVAPILAGALVLTHELGFGAGLMMFGLLGAVPLGQGLALRRCGLRAALLPALALGGAAAAWLVVGQVDLNAAGAPAALAATALVDGFAGAGAGLAVAWLTRARDRRTASS